MVTALPNLSVFAMNVVDVCSDIKEITGTTETQADFYNYLAEEMIDNTYDRFIMRSAEERRWNSVDSDDKNSGDDNPLICRINGAPSCGIVLHVTPTNNRRKKRDGK